MPHTLILACLVALAAAPAGAQQVWLARNGKATCAIVYDSAAPPGLMYGAAELDEYLGRICGERPLIVEQHAGAASQASDAESHERTGRLRAHRAEGGSHGVADILLVADASLAEEEFRIRTSSGSLVIAGGGQRGTLYGCIALLEEQLGCRWYNQRVTVVPKRRDIVLGPMDIHEKPAFEYREPYCREALNREWAVHNRCNGNFMPLDRSVGGHIDYGRFTHTFAEICPPKVYFKTHPEYFSLVNGKRMDGYAQLCLTNPDVLKLAIAKVKEWIKEDPEATIFSVSQNDTYYNCQCDNCKAVEREEGSASGPLLRFVNAVADAIGKEYPHVLIDTLAYQWSEDPPHVTRPRPNVRVRIAPLGACVGHGFDVCPANRHVLQNLQAWSRITDHNLYVWHYCTNFANYLQPLPDLDEIAHDVPLMHDSGVVGVFYEGDYAKGGGGDMQELKCYLMAKLLWNPDQPAEPIINEYIRNVYGKGAPYIRRWLDALQAPIRKQHMDVYVYDPPTSSYLPESTLREGDRLFDEAEAATHDTPAARDEVERARLGLQYVELMRAAPRYSLQGGALVPTENPARTVLAGMVREKIAKYGIGQVREGQPVAQFLDRLAQPAPSFPVVTIESARLTLTVVPALGGRIMRLVDRATGRNLLREPGPDDAGYPAAGGYEEYASSGSRGAGWNADFAIVASTPVTCTLRSTLRSGVELTRTYALDGAKLLIETTAVNRSDVPRAVEMRSHPEFTPARSGRWAASVADGSGRFSEMRPGTGGSGADIALPDAAARGAQAIIELGDCRVTQTWEPGEIGAVTLREPHADDVCLELVGKSAALAPGQSAVLRQTWEVVARR